MNRLHNVVSHIGPEEIIARRVGCCGLIELNRIKQLNALNMNMIERLVSAFLEFHSDSKVEFVLITGLGKKGFCAGGDIIALSKPIDDMYPFRFVSLEYTMNYMLATYPKPIISALHGITLGGGMGLSIHGKYRLITDNILMGMPETKIGIVNDVGTSHVLARCQGETGVYLAVTGEKLKKADVLYCGWGTHYVSQNAFYDTLEKLKKCNRVDMERLMASLEPETQIIKSQARLGRVQKELNICFQGKTMKEVTERVHKYMTDLNKDISSWAISTMKILTSHSPLAMHLALEMIRKARSMCLHDVLSMEYRLVTRLSTQGEDFQEGVKSAVLDKNHKPIWKDKIKDDSFAYYTRPYPDELELIVSKNLNKLLCK